MNIEKRRAEIAARKAEIRKLIEGDSENKLNMDDLEKELRELNEEDEKLEKRQAIERMLNGGAAPASPAGLSNPIARSANQPAPESTEKLYRSAWLKTLQGKPLTDDEKRAYSTAANSGLPIIPETTANQIIKKMYEVAPILQRCKIFHVPGNFKFAIEGTNDEAALHTENAAITAASDSLGSVSLTGYEIVKLVKASRACSEMALSAFESYIVEVIAEAVARRIEKYLFTGTGTNQPGGVKTAGKGASGAYTDGTDQITVGKTASLTEENVIALYSDTVVYVRLHENGCYVPCDEAEAGGFCIKTAIDRKDEETGETTTYLEDFVYAFAPGGLLGIEPVGSVENVSGTLMLAENDKVLDILLGGAAE